jgi:uncharacterized protein YdhG (YjbR/CyaY superfamily)
MDQSTDITAYIKKFPKETQVLLEQMRGIIRKAAPTATEVISYGMPAFKQERVLVYFAGNKNHIGFYPTSSPIRVFKDELTPYKSSKGAIQFPLDKKLPSTLITKMVKLRVLEDREKTMQQNKRVCKNGHTYFKSTDCPTCPQCEKEHKPKDGFLSLLSAPARRALEESGIKTPKQLARYTKTALLKLHGFGPASIPVLEAALKDAGLTFKS